MEAGLRARPRSDRGGASIGGLAGRRQRPDPAGHRERGDSDAEYGAGGPV